MSADWLPGVPLVESPFFEELVDSLGLDDETKRVARSLNRDGLAVLTFPEPELDDIADRLRSELAPHYAGSAQGWGARAERIFDGWRFSESVKRLAANPGILDLLRRTYGREPFPFQTNNFRVGTQQGVHTDAVHFQSVPERFVAAVWIALEDTDESNGPLVYYPGSHKLPIYSNEHVGVPAPSEDPYAHHDRFARLWQELVRVHGLERREIHVRKGQAVIWAANLLHAGARQKDPSRSRHTQATHYFFKGCCYYTPLLSTPFTGRIVYRQPVDIASGMLQASTFNGRPIPRGVIDAALRAPTLHSVPSRRALEVCSLRELFSPRDLPPQGLQVEADYLLLHPNGVGRPPATLLIDGVRLQAETHFVSDLEVANERSGPVVFGIELRDADGREIVARTYRLEGGGRTEAQVELPVNLSRCSLTLTTRMAPEAASSHYAWARFVRPRFTRAAEG